MGNPIKNQSPIDFLFKNQGLPLQGEPLKLIPFGINFRVRSLRSLTRTISGKLLASLVAPKPGLRSAPGPQFSPVPPIPLGSVEPVNPARQDWSRLANPSRWVQQDWSSRSALPFVSRRLRLASPHYPSVPQVRSGASRLASRAPIS